MVYAKADAQVCGVDPALQHPHVTLLINAHALRLATNASGREVSAVHVGCGGRQEVYSACAQVDSRVHAKGKVFSPMRSSGFEASQHRNADHQ